MHFMYDARTLSGWQHMRLTLNAGVAGLLILLLAACASPFGMGGGWVYNSRTNVCERTSGGISEDECQRQVASVATPLAAATAITAATQQARAQVATMTAASLATALARSLPTNTPIGTTTPTPRPPAATATGTPVATNAPQPSPTGSPQSGATLTVSPPKGERGTTFRLTLTGGQPNQRAQWVITHPTGYVERVSFALDTSGNFRDLEYKVSAPHPTGVYRNEVIQQDRVVATATFTVTE